MSATPIEELIADAGCFTCLGMSVAEALQVVLIDKISQLGPVASFIARGGVTDPVQISALNTLVLSAQSNGWWEKCDLIYPFVGGTAVAHAQNLKSTQFTITWNGTVTHDANGITGNGTTGYGNTGYSPAMGPGWSLDSAHLGFYFRNNGGGASVYGGADSGTVRANIGRPPFPATSAFGSINDNAGDGYAGLSLAWRMMSRTVSTTKHLFSGGVDNSTARASTSVINFPCFVLANDVSGVAGQFSSVNLAGMTGGAGISFAEYTAMAVDWQTFNTSLGRQV